MVKFARRGDDIIRASFDLRGISIHDLLVPFMCSYYFPNHVTGDFQKLYYPITWQIVAPNAFEMQFPLHLCSFNGKI